MTENELAVRALWLVTLVLLGLVGAVATVALLLAAGGPLPDALASGGAAGVGLVLLGLGVYRFLRG
jgi:hypothetical protein